MTRPKCKKKRKDSLSSDEFRNLKGAKRERMIVERKLSQVQLEKKVGCSVAMIGAIESGRATLGLEVSMKGVPAIRFKNPS
ncbi:helix-turn-helix domain-containing protein [Lysinibacillus fusiformis]